MGDVFTTLDLVIFFGALIGVMAVGLIAGRKEDTSEDYFLAGRSVRWFGVAGSIFGSNVSANHIVGMMGIGFSIGFAQSHFELGAIFGLLVLCFGFLPVYRKLKIYTLSEYLGRRYDDRSRVAYAVIMVVIMVLIQLVPGLYIGARTLCVLLGGDAMVEAADGSMKVNMTWYVSLVIALAAVSTIYTILGGLKAVIWTDVIQSVLLLGAGIVVAILTFQQVGGWGGMMALDLAGSRKMDLYRPINDPSLPWTGVFTGLIAMHCFYWGTNQFIVQRALGARSDSEAKLGIIAAGFLKLLIPFFAIASGVAAYYFFPLDKRGIDPDTVFPEVVKLVIPIGWGFIGLIAAGLIGAILSSIDSMMNSAATIFSVDIYKKYIKPEATDKDMILVGRVSILAFVALATFMALFVLDPNSSDNFFLKIADYQNYLTPGLLVAFLLGMFWKRATAAGAIATIIGGVLFSWVVQTAYNSQQEIHPQVYAVLMEQKPFEKVKEKEWPAEMKELSVSERKSYIEDQEEHLTPVNRVFGARLNFFHRVVGVIFLCVLTHVIVSLLTTPDPEKSRLTWMDMGGHSAEELKKLVLRIAGSIGIFALLGLLMVYASLLPAVAAVFSMGWTFAMYIPAIKKQLAGGNTEGDEPPPKLLRCDRFWAGILCSCAVFMHFYFYLPG